MAFLDSLPFDVIDYILNCECISFVDICRFACVSRILNSIASSNTLWKKKYKQMWPDLAVFYGASSTDWRNQFKRQYGYRNLVFKILSGLSSELYHVENISDESFSCLKEIVQQDELGYQIIITELENILYDSNSHLNLTHKYYAKKALRYVRHEQLKLLLQQYLSQPANELSLMEGACLISQWLQPTNSKCTVHVSSQITDIATRVLETVKQNCPNHPVVEHGLTDGILTQSLWTSSECKQILCYINAVMFKDMKFCVIDTIILDYMWYTFIDQVLNKKKGHNIILGIIYAAVAGKLGVSCAPVNYSRFILKWQDHTQSLGKKGAYALIDISESSSLNNKLIDLTQLIPGDELLSIDLTNAVHPVKVFERLVQIPLEIMLELQNVEKDNAFSMCDVLLLLCLFNPENIEIKFLLTGLYSQLGINATEAISILQKMAEHDPPITHEYRYQSTLLTLENMKTAHPSVKQNFRIRDHASKHVKFAVGMIMRHKKYNYRCVIYGWDPTCKASIHWIRQMGVYNLARKDKQPFYHVLVSDGTNRYAAEENLENDKENMPIEHIHVGRYFESFNDSYYVPNEQTELEYPDDKKVREKVLCSVQNG